MDQTLQYLKNAEKVLKANKFSDDEEFQLFMQNVFTELDGMEYRLACSHDGSSLLEIFLHSATPFQLAVFFDRLAGKYESMAGHRYASHVLETVFEAAGNSLASRQNGLKDSAEEQGLLPLDGLIIRAYEELKSSVISAIHDSYGSHVWRSLLQTFSKLPSYFEKTTASMANDLLAMDEGEGQGFRDLAFNQNTAPFFQLFLQVLSKLSDRTPFHNILEKLLFGLDLEFSKELDSSSGVKAKKFWKQLMEDDIGSRSAEVIIGLLENAQQVQSFYTQLIRGHACEFLQHPRANYPLQYLVPACRNSGQLTILLKEISPFLPNLLASRRFGILIKFAEWAVEHKEAHDEIVDAIFEAFHLEKTSEDRNLSFSLILRLQTKEYMDVSAPINPQGCALLIHLARFPEGKAKSFVDGLLRLNETEILSLSRNAAGSRVLEAFFVGGAMSSKALQRVGRHFKGHLIQIASDKYGSHVIEKLWKLSPIPVKNTMMEELSVGKERLESSPHGRLVVKNCRLDQFIRKREDWVQEEQTKTTKRSLLDDIING